MNILFDFITTQARFGAGACEYVRKVYYDMYNKIAIECLDVNVIGVHDSSIGRYPYEDFSPAELQKKCSVLVDISNSSLKDIVKQYNIDKIFVGLSQFWANRYDFQDIDCEIITVTHDIHDEELESIRLYGYLALNNSAYRQFRQIVSRFILNTKKKLLNHELPLKSMVSALMTNPKWHCITVSNYSKSSFMFHYGVPEEKIDVLYSPERFMESSGIPENPILSDIINTKRRYYLVVSAGRPEKNAYNAIKAFAKYRELYDKKDDNDKPLLVTLGMSQGALCAGHIDLPPLSESDLVCAYKNSYALLYPSFFEGFGYPPMEAMKFGIPVLASNVTSIPEVLGDSPIYFSPFYVSDIYSALCKLTNQNRPLYAEKSLNRYKLVNDMQNDHMRKLLDVLLF